MSESEHPSQEGGLYPEENEEKGGGPVKTFLEHLEDLRWTLLKCLAAVVLSMVFCLAASNFLVSFLTWPLDIAQAKQAESKDLSIYWGEKRLTVLPESVATNEFPEILSEESAHRAILRLRKAGTNRFSVMIELEPVERNDSEPGIGTPMLKNYSPIGPFKVAVQLMLYGGLVVASPFVIFFLGQFILPALHIHEKRFLYQTAGFGVVLFIFGVALCYFILMQIALKATVQFSQWMGFGSDEWRAASYISFVCKLMLAMGLSFQLPVVLLTMVKVGFLNYAKLVKFRPYWLIINLAVCAVLTPTGDPVTMILMAVPLQCLYELSVFISRFWEKREKESETSMERQDT